MYLHLGSSWFASTRLSGKASLLRLELLLGQFTFDDGRNRSPCEVRVDAAEHLVVEPVSVVLDRDSLVLLCN